MASATKGVEKMLMAAAESWIEIVFPQIRSENLSVMMGIIEGIYMPAESPRTKIPVEIMAKLVNRGIRKKITADMRREIVMDRLWPMGPARNPEKRTDMPYPSD